MTQICENLVIMHENSVDGNLYSKEYSHDNLITRSAQVINQTCFYGRSIAFHYTDSLRSLMRYLAVALASFSEAYYMKGAMALKTTNYFLRQPTYFLDPELCARRIMNVSRNCDVKFCKVRIR
jgi:Hormone-sensitive lipase (HSL) N-terminus